MYDGYIQHVYEKFASDRILQIDLDWVKSNKTSALFLGHIVYRERKSNP